MQVPKSPPDDNEDGQDNSGHSLTDGGHGGGGSPGGGGGGGNKSQGPQQNAGPTQASVHKHGARHPNHKTMSLAHQQHVMAAMHPQQALSNAPPAPGVRPSHDPANDDQGQKKQALHAQQQQAHHHPPAHQTQMHRHAMSGPMHR